MGTGEGYMQDLHPFQLHVVAQLLLLLLLRLQRLYLQLQFLDVDAAGIGCLLCGLLQLLLLLLGLLCGLQRW